MSDDQDVIGAQPARDEHSLLDHVAGVMAEIDRTKRERSAEGMRAARIHLAALHGVARLRRQTERQEKTA